MVQVEAESLFEETFEGTFEGGFDDWDHILFTDPPAATASVVLQET